MTVKALTLTQPWASLVALGEKRIETRSWQTHYRGPLAIHAARHWPQSAKSLLQVEPFLSALHGLRLEDFPLGAILAVGYLASIERTDHMKLPGEPELTFGDYRPGRYAWYLERVQKLEKPIPTLGHLGLWSWEPAML